MLKIRIAQIRRAKEPKPTRLPKKRVPTAIERPGFSMIPGTHHGNIVVFSQPIWYRGLAAPDTGTSPVIRHLHGAGTPRSAPGGRIGSVRYHQSIVAAHGDQFVGRGEAIVAILLDTQDPTRVVVLLTNQCSGGVKAMGGHAGADNSGKDIYGEEGSGRIGFGVAEDFEPGIIGASAPFPDSERVWNRHVSALAWAAGASDRSGFAEFCCLRNDRGRQEH
nr:hypothetical protein Iba_scaffold8000.4CG1390 [Ipomoea batatas]GME18460.1 hypothetical protein Iba_scaffold20607CG0060 [Ipomoea batatas]